MATDAEIEAAANVLIQAGMGVMETSPLQTAREMLAAAEKIREHDRALDNYRVTRRN